MKAESNAARAARLRMRPFHRARHMFTVGRGSPSDLMENCLAAIAEWEPEIGAFVHRNEEAAREAAALSTQRWRDGKELSLIDGMPVGIKDIVETIDMPTEMGSPLYKGWHSGRDAATVAALREAGAIVLGKTVTTEFAATFPGGTRNPWDLTRTPGGSSSGSAAAVAAGMISAGLGTQVVGSIIRPASFCGCVGFKPSLGAINRGGSHDALSQSCDGVLAASLEDAWNFCWAIAQRAGGDPGYPGLAGPERMPPANPPATLIVLETAGWELASPSAKAGFEDILERLRASNVAIIHRRNNELVDALETQLAKAHGVTLSINAWESRWPLNTYREKNAAGLSQTMLDRLAQAESMSIEDYRRALAERAHIRAVYARLSSFADAAITLSATGAAPVGLHSTGNPIFAVAGSLLGVPAVSLPVLADEGLPLGLQVMGFEQQDAALIGVAAWVRDMLQGEA
ncbi:MAG TPA: amidase [Micropepsaceae bacterium]|jgi:Asp-tRNA(Asn)/Glu-tRNA(Gln) amidotransferase A subunit family amidase|nr:amidase [Micropepsaceae bacterium]